MEIEWGGTCVGDFQHVHNEWGPQPEKVEKVGLVL